eukprot:TRINITY_DN8484_c0_g1_i1.p1 TRINITY_DN8484_c0_g1~~TRINITY_DN8484_c0_g1_i1.p1  ORF type:complete len:433 (+),score=119.03 TRINITY_DN8484_c0_g1_i1:254-1552(+)
MRQRKSTAKGSGKSHEGNNGGVSGAGVAVEKNAQDTRDGAHAMAGEAEGGGKNGGSFSAVGGHSGIPWGVVSTLLLAALVVFYKYEGNDRWVQGASCGMALKMQHALNIPMESDAMEYIKLFHQTLSSNTWMMLAAALAFASYNRGIHLYTYLIIGHCVKNISKSIIASPRGFYFCHTGFAEYCGTGFSLPSGHSMMSLSFSLYLLAKYPSVPTIIAVVLFEAWVVFEVMILGTHTPADVVIGFSYALWWFFFFRGCRRFWRLHQNNTNTSPALIMTCVLGSAALLMFALELSEESWDAHAVPPAEWAAAYIHNCDNVTELNVLSRMKNSSAFTKTAMLLGLLVGHFFRMLLGLGAKENVDKSERPTAQTVVWATLRIAIGVYTFYALSPRLAKQCTFLPAPLKRVAKYVVQELWVLVLAPLLFRLARIGDA